MYSIGLIGKSLGHSFSRKFFTEKAEQERINHLVQYQNFELHSIEEVQSLLAQPELVGFNITIPYKEEILAYADVISQEVLAIGAANVMVRIGANKWAAHNTDYLGFINSLNFEKPLPKHCKAIVLGTGGASKAVQYGLSKLGIAFVVVSSSGKDGSISYAELAESRLLENHFLVINTTPLGTFPNISELPPIPFEQLTEAHFLYDLVYNPAITAFLSEGIKVKACTRNGYEMLVEQALESWRLWLNAGLMQL